MEGKDTAAALEGLHAREPGNPEPLIKLAGKYQERQDREKALELSQKALALDPKGTRMMRRENGEVVSFKEMAEYQYARTFMVTFGLMDHQHLRDFIKKYPSSPLVRDAYLDVLRMLFIGEEGEEIYGKMIERFPHDPELANRLAEFLGMIGLGEGIDKILDLSLGFSTNALRTAESVSLPATAKYLAQLQILKGNPEKAEETYGSGFLAAQVDSTIESLMEYAEFWVEQKRNEKDAEAAIDLALGLNPGKQGLKRRASVLFNSLGKMDKALEIYGPEFLKTVQTSPADLFSYFNLWTRKKANETSAFEALDRLLELEPESVYYRSVTASVLWTTGHQDRARAVFGAEFLAGHSGNMNTLFEYGAFWIQRNSGLEQAVPALIQSLQTMPKSYMSQRQAAQSLMKIGRSNDALAFYGPAYLSGIQSDPEALAAYADFWNREAKTNAESAAQAIETAARLPSLTMWTRMQLARLFLNSNKPGRAEEVYGPAYLKTVESDAEALIRYASYWKSLNRNLFSALEAARKACAVAPDEAKAWSTLVDVCVVTDNPKEGLAAVEKALQLTKSQKEREKLETLKKQIQAALDKKEGSA